MECIFCAIVAGKIPSRQVYADETAIAFLDIEPWHRGHTLVIPRRHADDLDDPTALSEIAPAISAVSSMLKSKLGAPATNVLINSGAVAGQEVFHLHAHVVPRTDDNPGVAGLFKRQEYDIDEVWSVLNPAVS